MERKVTIFVMCATVVQCTLPTVWPNAPEITAETMTDLSILRAYQSVANLQSEKVVISILDILRRSYFAKIRCGNREPNDQLYNTTETCENGLLAPFTAAHYATLEAILIVNPKGSSAVTTARIVGDSTNSELVKGICTAIALTVEDNSSATSPAIQTIADKQASGAVTFNEAYFAALLNDQNNLVEIKIAVESAHREANIERVTAIRDMFSIFSEVPSGTQNENHDDWSVIVTILNQVLVRLSADIEIKLGLLENFTTMFSVIQNKTDDDFSMIQVVEDSAFSDCEEVVNGSSTRSNADDPNVAVCPIGNQTKIVTDNRAIAIYQAVKGIDTIFSAIEDFEPKFNVINSNPPAIGSSTIQTAKKKASAAWKAYIAATMNAVSIASPQAVVTITSYRNAAISAALKAVDVIFDAIDSMKGEDSFKILTETQAMENAAIHATSTMMVKLYIGLESDQEMYSKYEDKIEHAREKSISEVQKLCHAIFEGIRACLAELIPEIEVESSHGKSVKSAQADAFHAIKDALHTHFHLMETLSSRSAENHDEEERNELAIETHYETAKAELENAVEQIFSYMKEVAGEASAKNGNVSEYESSETETVKKNIYAVCNSYIDAIMDALRNIKLGSSSAVRNVQDLATSEANEAIDRIFISMNSIKGKDTSTILNEIQTLEDAAIRHVSAMMMKIYDGMRSDRKRSANHRDVIAHAEKNSISRINKSYHAIFAGIRIGLSNLIPTIQIGTTDGISSMEDAQTEAYHALKAAVHACFDVMQILSSSSNKHQGGIVENLSKIRSHRETAMVDVEKSVEMIFSYIKAFTVTKPKIKYEPDDDSGTIKTNREKIAVACEAYVKAVTDALLIVNPEASSAIRTAQDAKLVTMNKIIDLIYAGINLNRDKNSPTILNEIQKLEDAVFYQDSIVIANCYDGIPYDGEIPAQLQAEVERARKNSDSKVNKVSRTIFTTIKNLLVGNKGGISSIKAAHSEASLAIRASFHSYFDVIQIIYIISAKDLTSLHTNLAAIRSYREIVKVEVGKNVDYIFDSIIANFPESIHEKENVSEYNSGEGERLKKEISAANEAYVDTIMNAVLICNPGASSAVRSTRNAAIDAVNGVIDFIYEVSNLSQNKDFSTVQSEIQKMEEAVLGQDSIFVEKIYDAVQNVGKAHVEDQTEIERLRRKSESNVKKASLAISTAIRIYLTKSQGDISSIEAAHTETSSTTKAVIQNIFDALRLICLDSVEKQAAIRSYQEKAMVEVDNAVDLIFNYITYKFSQVDLKNENVPHDDWSENETPEEKTYAAFLKLFNAVLDTILKIQRETPEVVETTRYTTTSLLRKGVHSVYMGINFIQGNNSSKILTEIEAIEDISMCNARRILLDVYFGIKKGLQFQVKMNPGLIESARENALSNVSKIVRAIFAVIKFVVSAIFPENQAGSKNNLSSIMAAQNEAYFAAEEYIYVTFDLLKTLASVCRKQR